MFCIRCGANNPDDYNFCYKCGQSRPAEAAQAEPEESDDSLIHQAFQSAIHSMLDKDLAILERKVTDALKTPDKSLHEIMNELQHAAETEVDEDTVKRAKKVLEVLIENEDNSVSFPFRHGTIAPYEAAFNAESFFRRRRHARTILSNNKLDPDISVIRQDYRSYIRGGLEALLPYCPNIDNEASAKLLSLRGIRIWLEYNIAQEMLMSLSLDRRKVVRDDVSIINSRLGPELTNKLMNYLTDLLSVVRWD